ncbi:MAG: hypothetical protein LBI76_06045, partial [Comamonas sp.]|nr:hypothetical protein [Comamonas sp.]
MSHKHPTSLRRARLAPLAAAAALIAATSGVALAQTNSTVPVVGPTANQTSDGPVSALNTVSGQINSFPTSGTVTSAPIPSLAIGNQHQLANGAQAALVIPTQSLVQPTVTIVQQVTDVVSATTRTNIGVNANNVQGNHDHDTAGVSGNQASSDAIGNTSVGTMLFTGGAVDMNTAATAAVTQGVDASAPISASTDLTRVGIRLNQNGGNAMDDLRLSVSGNQVSSDAQANTTQAGIQVQASSVTLSDLASSTVDQQAAGSVTGKSDVNLVGIRVLGTPNRAVTGSQLG